MSKLDDLKVDLDEIQKFFNSSTRPRVRSLLERELGRVKEEMEREEQKASPGTSVKIEKTMERRPQVYTKKIVSYGWDQSEKFVKLYVTLPGVETLGKEKVSASFTPTSADLMVRELDGKNHQLQILNLLNKISPADSYVKIKPGSVTVLMKKSVHSNWSCLTAVEKATNEMRAKPAEKFDENKDPGEGIMDLMRKMYDEGDDEMKRTIAKAWSESRDKTSQDLSSF